jgi:hypothetical protein
MQRSSVAAPLRTATMTVKRGLVASMLAAAAARLSRRGRSRSIASRLRLGNQMSIREGESALSWPRRSR